MKICVVTGRLMKDYAYKICRDFADVFVVNRDIAAFMTKEDILKAVKNTEKYDLMIVPGYIKEDLSKIEKDVGIPVFRGTKSISDLRELLENIKEIKLYKDIPADDMLRDVRKEKFYKRVANYEKNADFDFKIGNLKIGKNSMPKIAAEIIDAPKLKNNLFEKMVERYIEEGAEIIDIGMFEIWFNQCSF